MSKASSYPAKALLLASFLLVSDASQAIDSPKKATIAVVGDADHLNVGQDGFCGKRTTINQPSGISFDVPAGRKTWFYLRSKFRTTDVTNTCEAEFAFTPEAGLLHIIRFTFPNDKCYLEAFRAQPGQKPERINVEVAPSKACIMRK
ncbi:MAG: hypothetical protein JSS25_06360 [Proteobacteria bacterium]|nr:hypothetical protein [Pseudomonadota bacterium]